MKINGEYPKFYMRVEGKRYAAVEAAQIKGQGLCLSEWDNDTECAFLWVDYSVCGNLSNCQRNNVIYVEVPEE